MNALYDLDITMLFLNAYLCYADVDMQTCQRDKVFRKERKGKYRWHVLFSVVWILIDRFLNENTFEILMKEKL